MSSPGDGGAGGRRRSGAVAGDGQPVWPGRASAGGAAAADGSGGISSLIINLTV